MKKHPIAILLFLLTVSVFISLSAFMPDDKKAKFKDPKIPVEDRIKDLLSRMTIEEKVAQTFCIWEQAALIVDEKGEFSPEKAKKILEFGLGQIGRASEKKSVRHSARDMADFTNTIQKYVIENTRLGIPVIFHDECLHGLAAKEATSFPQPIALASSWNTELVTEIFTLAAEEARSRGACQVLSPVLDVARDPRWGRVEETYGEDPYLNSQIGLACVKALQGPGPGIDKKHVASTLKHFTAHGQPESGTNCAPANYSERTIREVFLPAFKTCVMEGHVMSVMASYNEIDGIPSHANKWLLTDILRKEWGFQGFIISDYYAVTELETIHHIAKNKEDAAQLAFQAGVDIESPELAAYQNLPKLIKEGKVAPSVLDTAVARILRVKFLLGLFEDPYVDPDNAEKVAKAEKSRELALKAARQCIVLLKNENNLLPLKKKGYKAIAVIGPNANKCLLGGYSGEPIVMVSPLEGIKNKVGKDIPVLYSEGCKITKDGGAWTIDKVELSDPKEDAILIKEAVETAKNADVAILFLGGNEQTSREAWSKTHMGDRTNLGLIGAQNDLVKAVLATGKPTIVFLSNGSPLTFNYINDNVPAILEGWYLGQETGTAVADVIFGDYNPSGKLTITFPRNEGQIPVFYNYKPSARRGYIFDTTKPLYPFGYGLSYTTYKYSNLKLSKDEMPVNGSVTASVDVTNTGKVAGDEVVQLYIHDLVSSVTRPIKELKGFKKISLAPGEMKTITSILLNLPFMIAT
jgi:beta-glucosidase